MPLSYLLYTREICKGTLDFRKGCTSAPLANPLVYLYIHNGYKGGTQWGIRKGCALGVNGIGVQEVQKGYERYGELYEDVQRVRGTSTTNTLIVPRTSSTCTCTN